MDGQTLLINDTEYHFSQRQLKYRYLFKNSKYLCAKYLCGFNEGAVAEDKIAFPMNWHLHGSILYQIQHEDPKRLALELPRGGFKSSMIAGDCIHEIINNRNVRLAMSSGNMAICKAFLQHQKNVITSPLFGALFPEIPPKYSPNSPLSDWSKTQYTVNRDLIGAKEPTVYLFTSKSKIEGWHFDKIYYDDCQNRENSKRESGRLGVKEFYEDGANLVTDINTPVFYIFTPWHPDDANEEVKKRPNVTKCRVPLYDNDGNCFFPEKFTPEFIQSIRDDLSRKGGGDKMFTTQYLLQAVSGVNAPLSDLPGYMGYWIEEKEDEDGNIVEVRVTEDGREFKADILATMISMDTSGEGEDTCGIGSIQQDNDDNWFIQYAKEGKGWLPSRRFKELIELDNMFHARKIGVEVFGQITIKELIGEENLNNSDVGYKFKEMKHHSKGKDERIMNRLEPKLAAGKVFWHIGVPETAKKQVKYYREWGQDTIPDMLAYGIQMFEEEGIRPVSDKPQVVGGWKPRRPRLFGGRI